MEILAPDISLIIWTLLALLHLVLSVIMIIQLSKLDIDPWMKWSLLGCILFIPLFGPVLFVAYRKAKLAERMN